MAVNLANPHVYPFVTYFAKKNGSVPLTCWATNSHNFESNLAPTSHTPLKLLSQITSDLTNKSKGAYTVLIPLKLNPTDHSLPLVHIYALGSIILTSDHSLPVWLHFQSFHNRKLFFCFPLSLSGSPRVLGCVSVCFHPLFSPYTLPIA